MHENATAVEVDGGGEGGGKDKNGGRAVRRNGNGSVRQERAKSARVYVCGVVLRAANMVVSMHTRSRIYCIAMRDAWKIVKELNVVFQVHERSGRSAFPTKLRFIRDRSFRFFFSFLSICF